MRLRSRLLGLVGSASFLAILGALSVAASLPPGRQHRLMIEGENTVTFLPRSGLPALKIDYKARFEYIVDTRLGKEPKAPTADPPPTPIIDRNPSTTTRTKAKLKARDGGAPANQATGGVDLSLHSSEIAYRQNGQTVVETRMSRAKFQGRLQPDAPVMSVAAKDAPPRLQELLKIYDTPIATMLVNDEDQVVDLKIKIDGPQRPVIETMVSIHAPMPRDVDLWEASSRLAMGHGQTAKGKLRFEKVPNGHLKAGNVPSGDVPEGNPRSSPPRTIDRVKVKVSGVLKGEGIVAGNFIKDGTYTVDGEQTYDPQTREWIASRWSVDVNNELANQAGLTVAQARGKMVVESRAVEGSATSESPR